MQTGKTEKKIKGRASPRQAKARAATATVAPATPVEPAPETIVAYKGFDKVERPNEHGVSNRFLDDATNKANARLIAAAPELLEALKAAQEIVERDAERMLDSIGNGEDAEGKADGAVAIALQVRDAIARAEGRS